MLSRLDGPTLLQLLRTRAMAPERAGAILAALSMSVHKTPPPPDVISLRDLIHALVQSPGNLLPKHLATGARQGAVGGIATRGRPRGQSAGTAATPVPKLSVVCQEWPSTALSQFCRLDSDTAITGRGQRVEGAAFCASSAIAWLLT